MKAVHVASAPVICKSQATESLGEGIDPESLSEAIKGQLHACREGPQHAAAGPVECQTLCRLACASSDRKPEASLLLHARYKHSLSSNRSEGQPLALMSLRSAKRKEVRPVQKTLTAGLRPLILWKACVQGWPLAGVWESGFGGHPRSLTGKGG